MKETEQYKISFSLQKKQTGIVDKISVTTPWFRITWCLYVIKWYTELNQVEPGCLEIMVDALLLCGDFGFR